MSKLTEKYRSKFVKEDVYTEPTIWNDGADIDRLNDMLDNVTSKPFINPQLAVTGIRAALDMNGITLPELEIEKHIPGPDVGTSRAILSTGTKIENVYPDVEYLFKITDADENVDKDDGVTPDEDWDNHLYLYIVVDRNDETGFFEAYAQVVTSSEVDELINMDIPEIEHEYPEMFGDVSGESDYLKQTRHVGAISDTSIPENDE